MFEVTGFEWSAASAEKLSKIMLMDGQYIRRIVWDDAVDQYEVSQFTGLSDKNGKEIYEGDVVRLSGTRYTNKIETIDPVYYDTEKGCFGPFHHCIDNESRWIDVEHSTEIVGNIYENPEMKR